MQGRKGPHVFFLFYLYLFRIGPFSRADINGGPDKAIPIKCFVSHRPVSCDGGSVGREKKKKNEHFYFCILNLTFNL